MTHGRDSGIFFKTTMNKKVEYFQAFEDTIQFKKLYTYMESKKYNKSVNKTKRSRLTDKRTNQWLQWEEGRGKGDVKWWDEKEGLLWDYIKSSVKLLKTVKGYRT